MIFLFALIKKFFAAVAVWGGKLIKADGFFFVVLTILNAPIIFFSVNVQEGAVNFWLGALALFLLTAAIHLLPLKIRRLLQATLITLFAVLFVTNIFLLQAFAVPPSHDILQILLATNFVESKEFLQEYVINFKVLGSLAAFIFLLAALSFGLKKFFATYSAEKLKRLSMITIQFGYRIKVRSACGFDRYFSVRCDEKFFIESKDKFARQRQVDGVLLPVLDEFIAASTAEKNFYVIHLYGTHGIYSERYPAEFEKFSAADKDKNAVLIYIFDHGEEEFPP